MISLVLNDMDKRLSALETEERGMRQETYTPRNVNDGKTDQMPEFTECRKRRKRGGKSRSRSRRRRRH